MQKIGAFLGNNMPHLDDIWYGGRARAEGDDCDLHGGQRSTHQRSNGVNYVLWLPYLVKRSADAS